MNDASKSEFYLACATENTDGKAVKIDGYDDCIIGTTTRPGECTVLCYSFRAMLDKYIKESGVVLDADGYERAQALADLLEEMADRQNDFGDYSPIVVDDL